MPYKSSSAVSDVRLARFGLRIIRAMRPSAARSGTAERVALGKRARRRLRQPRPARVQSRPVPGRNDRRDSDVAKSVAHYLCAGI